MLAVRRFKFASFASLALGLLAATIATDGARAQTEWERDADAPVLTSDAATWEGSFGLYSPTVLGTAGAWTLWYNGADSIGRAVSADGVEWSRQPGFPVLRPGSGWDNSAIYEPCVIEDPLAPIGERFKMWYNDLAPPNQGVPDEIGYAVSADGVSWRRKGDAPVVRPDQPWEGSLLDGPCVVFDGSRYHLWYAGFSGTANAPDLRSGRLGYATSSDGELWGKHAANPVLSEGTPENRLGVFAPSVIWHETSGTFEMWYSVNDGFTAWLQYAASCDGIDWATYPGNPVFVADGIIDPGNVQSASVFFDGSRYRMWYSGGIWQGINLFQIGAASAPWSIPRASFSASTDALSVAVDASKSVTPNGSITDYEWDFGDGSSVEPHRGDPRASYGYRTPGHYPIRLAVTDDKGKRGYVARGVDVQVPAEDLQPWNVTGVGEPHFEGRARHHAVCAHDGSSGIRVWAGGRLLVGREDQFLFVHQEVAGDAVAIEGKVVLAEKAEAGWQAGVMLRESLGTGSRYLAMTLHKANAGSAVTLKASGRSGVGLSTSKTGEVSSTLGEWLRVERRGEDFVALHSSDRQNWSELYRLTLAGAPEALFAGIVAIGNDVRPAGRFVALDAALCSIRIDDGSSPGIGPFLRGDGNGDAKLDIADASHLLNFLFLGGDDPPCVAAADCNGDGGVNIADPSYALNFLFLGDRDPPAPFPDCATSVLESDAELGCDEPRPGCER
jgi:predicted GH43/DUF377 family glycosyl hydrolase